MSCDKSFDQADDSVDPRVQVELERLNTATDEINKLEVDLDEARNQFRQLLYESTVRIESCAKKLGNCIEKARPYYDARLKAKEALQETQKAAVNFERANSAHAAAKEMVYLAEEGLKTEGRTFDHAWQEMLNHATMRVNESESERTRAETEHKKTSQFYQQAEIRVQTLQKELKRAITKSSLRIRRQLLLLTSLARQHDLLHLPYFELKIHYNQLLEQQKNKVKTLEKQVSEVKMQYAETLRNLEQISDEIHRTRQSNKNSKPKVDLGSRLEGVGAETNQKKEIMNNHADLPNSLSGCAKTTKSFQNDSSNVVNSKAKDDKVDQETTGKLHLTHEPKMLTPLSETSTAKLTPNTPGSSQPDTDFWSESSENGKEGNGEGDSCTESVDNDSSITGPPDSESEDEFFKLPDKLGAIASPNVHKGLSYEPPSTDVKTIENHSNSKPRIEKQKSNDSTLFNSCFEGIGICSFPVETDLNINFNEKEPPAAREAVSNNDSCWTEINLSSPGEEQFLTMRKGKSNKIAFEVYEEEFDIPYAPLSEAEVDFAGQNQSLSSPDEKKEEEPSSADTKKLDRALANWVMRSGKGEDQNNCNSSDPKSCKNTPRKTNARRQSLDVLWSNATGEKMKEILSQSIMKFSIGSLTERRSSESKIDHSDNYQNESAIENSKGNEPNSYESSLTSQFGLQFFGKKNSKTEEEIIQSLPSEEKKASSPQDTISYQIGSFISKKDRFFNKKVPSPLEKTLGYLNPDEESNSDSESLASMDMLTDEQLSSLVLDLDLREIYQDIIS